MDNGYVDDEFVQLTLGIDKPRIEDWYVGPNDMLIGNVYNDSRFKDGELIITSRVVSLDKTTGVVTTKNNEYILGKPANEN